MKKNQPTTAKTSTKKINSQQPTQKKTNPVKPIQNLKQFKNQIDHQIAKCLDTLDRQGLKYLRQTLKSSNIFDEQIKQQILTGQNKEKKMQKYKSPTKPKNGQQIQQQITEEYDKQQQQRVPKKNLQKDKSEIYYLTHKPRQEPVKLQKFEDKLHQPIKPFPKRSSSRAQSRAQIDIQKSKVQAKMPQAHRHSQQQIKDKSQIDLIVQKIGKLPKQKLQQLNKVIQKLQKSQNIDDQLKMTRPYILKNDDEPSIPNQSNMRSSQQKAKKNEKATSLHESIMKGNKKNSGKNEEKQQQIKQQQVKQQANYQEIEQQIQQNNQIDEQIPQFDTDKNANHPKIMDIPDKLFKNTKNQEKAKQFQNNTEIPQRPQQKQTTMGKKTASDIIMKKSFLKNLPIANIKKPLDIQVTESHQADTLQLNQGASKLVRVGMKKLGTNKVKIVLVNNRGHASIVGLTCIQFYNANGKVIPISVQNVKSPTGIKIMKLFNGVYKTTDEDQMFTTMFKRDFEIELQIPEKICGMRIWNYNKSQIQSSKQTDWIEFYINDRLRWEGLIKKGSYNQLTDYCTEAEIQEDFKFSQIKKQDGFDKINQIKQQSEGPSSSENIKIDSPIKSGTYIQKQKQKDTSKVDWLERTLMEQKIKQIKQQDKRLEQRQQKKSTNKIGRGFSQLFQQSTMKNKLKQKQRKQESKLSKDIIQGESKQLLQVREKKSIDDKVQFKQQKSNINIAPVQRTVRTNSQKVQQQKDIFNAFSQSFRKQKIEANKINTKVGEFIQKAEKLKETYRLQPPQFGYESLINKSQKQIIQPKPQPKQQIKEKSLQLKQKKPVQKQSLSDFMNDSLFQDDQQKNQKKVPILNRQQQYKQIEKQKPMIHKKDSIQKIDTKNVDLDDLLSQLNDVVGTKGNRYQFGSEKQKTIVIPQLPKGNQMEIHLLTNWGDSQNIGINKIQFFDNQGQRVFPSQAKTNIAGASVVAIFSQNNGFITQEGNQWKCQKKQNIKLELTFSKKIQFAFIRFWNYIGDRVHSMCGVRKVHIVLDGSLIFAGDIRKNGGTSREDTFKSCEQILFTNNGIIQKRIAENDWLAQQMQVWKQQTVIFKKTLQNFLRPMTNGLANQKQIKIAQNKQPIKLPKRNCFQYDPPNLPCGYYLKLTLHTSWGDLDFIGLNGIVIFDENGNQITPHIKKISQFPAPLITLAGYENDKRRLKNLFDGKNLTSNDQSIWLAPFLRDIDKMQKQAQNAILIQFEKPFTISAVNIYNYLKTPKRGVRQIELHIDQYLVYRGYLRMANHETGQVMTTINFTKQQPILQKINYSGYNQDNIGQQVNFINQGKQQKPMF